MRLIEYIRGWGPGLLESVYEVVPAHELETGRMRVERQAPVRINYDEMSFDEAFRADLVVEEKVIVELKSVANAVPVHTKQILTYLRLNEQTLLLLAPKSIPKMVTFAQPRWFVIPLEPSAGTIEHRLLSGSLGDSQPP